MQLPLGYNMGSILFGTVNLNSADEMVQVHLKVGMVHVCLPLLYEVWTGSIKLYH